MPASIPDMPDVVLRALKPGETPQALSRAGYNSVAQRYNEWSAKLTDHKTPYAEKLLSLLTSSDGAQLLELGCGAGPSLAKFVQSSKIARAVGVDISSAQLELAQAGLDGAGVPRDRYELVEADMLEVEFGARTFDAVCAFYSLIQLAQEQQRTVLRKCFEWMKPGGCMVFNVADEEIAGEVMDGWLGMQPGAFWASFGREGTVRVIRDIGFEVDDVTTTQDVRDASFAWIIARKPS